MGQASAYIEAPPEKVYDAISDVRRMGEWSPECRRCEWLDGAGPAVGARFKGSNRNGIFRWSTKARVVTADEGREFAFATNITEWRYRFEPEGSGTRVTESFQMIADEPFLFDFAQRYLMGIKDRRADLEQNIEATLGRVKSVIEGPPG